MNKEKIIKKINSKIEELPTLPEVISKILTITDDTKSNISDVTKIISRDPALMSKILKVANSAYYGSLQNVSELDSAVKLLGFNMVRSLALSIGVITSLPGGRKVPYFSPEGLWWHSGAVAILIRELGKKYHKKEPNEYLFTIGLLHDIGKIVLCEFFHDEFHEALVYANERENIELINAEKATLGIDHFEIGSMLLKRWNFPEKIINPITFQNEKILPADISRLDVVLLRLANSLAQELAPGEEGNIVANMIEDKDLKFLKILENNLNDLRDLSQKRKNEIQDFFKALV